MPGTGAAERVIAMQKCLALRLTQIKAVLNKTITVKAAVMLPYV